ncbi:alanine--tRNA ligase-related protein [Fusobacterium perfoetens]|uniref:alanine--tRNA ligase-related protein n=1 Tax=Fusobacterium perfoetens TaxID=852 RepID=UPI000486789C|nr:alanine--tRNA ligase-related protein [Fusobacterium perfoetens]MCI6152103.1 alanine--tRNA ligase-related protein [Fusobacterium perfoetens]MDY3238006.1 alanine--tRNA ligase-related protein [Fusobacterium perfoetens]
MKTEKLFYKNQFLSSCKGILTEINEDGVIFDKTVAYPEGGGQIGDIGYLIREKTNEKIEFFNTTKIKGRNIFLEDFPSIKVENLIVHHIDKEILKTLEIGESFIIKIDTEKRARTTLHHSGLHLALMVLETIRPNIRKSIVGAKITSTYGRLDFATENKFSKDELLLIEEKSNSLIEEGLEIVTFPHKEEKEALYWQCLDYCIPCGGTHCENTKYLGKMKVKRKNIGKTSERLIIELSEIENFRNLYL